MDVMNTNLSSVSPATESSHTIPPSSPAFDAQVT